MEETFKQGGDSVSAEAVREAKTWLNFQRRFDGLAESLFDSIIVHEIAPATALAMRMLGDYTSASEAVYAALETAKGEFASYDAAQSPRVWVLQRVADEVMQRAEVEPVWDLAANDVRATLLRLPPERRLAIVLTDMLGMTDEEAAQVARVDVAALRDRARSARAWLSGHVPGEDADGQAAG